MVFGLTFPLDPLEEGKEEEDAGDEAEKEGKEDGKGEAEGLEEEEAQGEEDGGRKM